MPRVRYIAVDGVIGVGKTSLVHRLQAEAGGRRFLELVEENPFLTGGFYRDMERLAFDTEVFFLLARFRQQRELASALGAGDGPVLTDYLFAKSRIFASITLSPADYSIWSRVYESLDPEVPRPDLAIYLRSPTDRLLERIQLRNRPFERDIEAGYLDRVNAGYDRFFAEYPGQLLTIDVTRLDFVGSEADFTAVRAMVEHKIGTIEAGQGELDLLGRDPAGAAGGGRG